MPLALLGMLNFVFACGEQNWQTTIYLGPSSPRSSSGTCQSRPPQGTREIKHPEVLLPRDDPSLCSGCSILQTACGRQNRHTALHSGKDLAVSFPHRCGTHLIYPKGKMRASGFRLERFCSHLFRPQGTDDRRYLLPFSCKSGCKCSDFPPSSCLQHESCCLAHFCIIQQKINPCQIVRRA